MAGPVLLESFTARGHTNVRACHRTTLEFTRDAELTARGDCIVGVASNLAPAGFKAETKAALRAGLDFVLVMRVDDLVEEIHGCGDPELTLDDEHEMVFRKSAFVSGRTVLVACDKASADLGGIFRARVASGSAEIHVSLFLAT